MNITKKELKTMVRQLVKESIALPESSNESKTKADRMLSSLLELKKLLDEVYKDGDAYDIYESNWSVITDALADGEIEKITNYANDVATAVNRILN